MNFFIGFCSDQIWYQWIRIGSGLVWSNLWRIRFDRIPDQTRLWDWTGEPRAIRSSPHCTLLRSSAGQCGVNLKALLVSGLCPAGPECSVVRLETEMWKIDLACNEYWEWDRITGQLEGRYGSSDTGQDPLLYKHWFVITSTLNIQ